MTGGRLCSWRICRSIATLFVVIGLSAQAARADQVPGPEPLVSLDDRGPSLPPVGRSVFDFLVAEQVDGEWLLTVPYPFEALIDHLEAGLRAGYREPIKRVLHPVGRSLHRHSAAPYYFRYPRAVAAVDTESDPAAGQSGAMLKDRLYLGYQPLTDSIELIAYNEAAGRFEYQVVTDYREGGNPKVTYIDRGVCTACHHNQALIYAGQPWDESNNNLRIAALLRAEAESFYGIPAQVAFDIPESFDEATDRANFFAAYQLAWQNGCQAVGDYARAVACRRDGLVTALRYRLTSGYQLSDPGDGARDRFAKAVTKGWLERWPHGVSIPTADLLDRDPFEEAGYGTGRVGGEDGLVELAALAAADLMQFDEIYEPLYERPPLDVWKVAPPLAGLAPVEPRWMNQVIGGLGDFLAAVDIERLDTQLAASAAEVAELSFPCQVIARDIARETVNIRFRCEAMLGEATPLKGQLRLAEDGVPEGLISRVRADSAAPGGMVVSDGVIEQTEQGWRARFTLRDGVTGLNARLANGNLLRGIVLAWPAAGGAVDQPVEATATLSVADDFAPLVAAVDALAEATLAGDSDALANAPFRRVAVLRPIFDELGLGSLDWCCLDADHLPPPVLHEDVE